MPADKKSKIVVITGPTATGKSDLGVALAKKFNGEIISADSRQVYTSLDIGTGKITKREMRGVPHFLLDVKSPRSSFTAGDFAKRAARRVTEITARGHLPLVVGGTGFYIEALLSGHTLPEVPPNPKLRSSLEQYSAQELFETLSAKDPQRAATMAPHNKRRLIRALEIVEALGRVPAPRNYERNYDTLMLGIDLPDEALKARIRTRVEKRLQNGFIEEVERLNKNRLSWKRLDEIGLGYAIIADHLRGKIKKDTVLEKITTAEWQYARKQRQWFKRDNTIHWFAPTDTKRITALIEKFLT